MTRRALLLLVLTVGAVASAAAPPAESPADKYCGTHRKRHAASRVQEQHRLDRGASETPRDRKSVQFRAETADARPRWDDSRQIQLISGPKQGLSTPVDPSTPRDVDFS